MGYHTPLKSVSWFTSRKQGQSTTQPALFTWPTSTIYISHSAHVLGVIPDKNLTGSLTFITSSQGWLARLMSTRLTVSAWGTFLWVLRLLYTAVIWPAISTSCPAWWAPSSTPLFKKGPGEDFQNAKNCCLRIMSGTYKATPIQSLQPKVSVLPLWLPMDRREAGFCLQFLMSGIDIVIDEGITNIRQFLSCTRTQTRHSRTFRNQQTTSHPHPTSPSPHYPASLAASQHS